jgi:Spy/CpxP family protein refolding chaperone
MEIIMTRNRKTLLVLATAAALAVGTLAQADSGGPGRGPGDCPQGSAQGYGPGGEHGSRMMGPGRGHGRGDHAMRGQGARHGAGSSPAARVEGRLAALKSELKITSEQESAWQAFEGKAKAMAGSMQSRRAAATPANLTAPERLAQRAAFAKQGAANLESMSAAVKDLYEALTPEQKAIADQRMAFGGRAGPGRRGGPRGSL